LGCTRQTHFHASSKLPGIRGKPARYATSSTLALPFKPDPVKCDSVLARRLLAEAGYASGLEFRISTSPGLTGNYISDLLAGLQRQLEVVGVNVQADIINAGADHQPRRARA